MLRNAPKEPVQANRHARRSQLEQWRKSGREIAGRLTIDITCTVRGVSATYTHTIVYDRRIPRPLSPAGCHCASYLTHPHGCTHGRRHRRETETVPTTAPLGLRSVVDGWANIYGAYNTVYDRPMVSRWILNNTRTGGIEQLW
jgi:hypothetical protein